MCVIQKNTCTSQYKCFSRAIFTYSANLYSHQRYICKMTTADCSKMYVDSHFFYLYIICIIFVFTQLIYSLIHLFIHSLIYLFRIKPRAYNIFLLFFISFVQTFLFIDDQKWSCYNFMISHAISISLFHVVSNNNSESINQQNLYKSVFQKK